MIYSGSHTSANNKDNSNRDEERLRKSGERKKSKVRRKRREKHLAKLRERELML